MERQGDEVHVNTSEARGGSTPHIVRYILAISLLLVVVAFAIIVMTGALSSAQPDRNGPVSGQATPAPQ
jgi:hypothetical protein